MVATLIRYEWLRTWRVLALIFGGALLFTGMSALAASVLPGPLNMVFAIVGIVVTCAFPIVLTFLLGVDFYRSTFSKTGYFTAAIPARGATIFWVKFGYGCVFALLGLAGTVGLAILANIGFVHATGGTTAQVLAMIDAVRDGLGMLPLGLRLLVFGFVLIYPCATLAQLYFAATVGSEATFSRLGLGGPVLVWFLYYVGTQLAAILGLFLPPTLDITNPLAPTVTYDPLAFFRDNQTGSAFLPLAAILMTVVVAVVAIVWAKVSYDKRLELR
ncbi:MAG: hypothetical protein QM713_16765 [Arachnia sp.]